MHCEAGERADSRRRLVHQRVLLSIEITGPDQAQLGDEPGLLQLRVSSAYLGRRAQELQSIDQKLASNLFVGDEDSSDGAVNSDADHKRGVDDAG